MRNLFLLMFFLHIFSIISLAQTDFKWDIIIDSLAGNKDELYSKTKVFIAEEWKSAKDVIQNDDREAGIILLKGEYQITPVDLFREVFTYTFSYTIKFYQKDNKCRIVLDEVKNISARNEKNGTYLIPVADLYQKKKVYGMKENVYLGFMANLKGHLQSKIDSYVLYSRHSALKNTDW